jgi:hypothetical protein
VPSVNTNWSEYRNELGPVESFDVYVGPITSFYSQVWWAALPEARLPDHIRRRFNDTAMAIIGYEVDQVRRKGDKDRDGSILPEDISVPINVAYNHHHDAYFTGRHSRMERVPYDPSDRTVSPMARADPDFLFEPVEHSRSPRGLPTSAHLAAVSSLLRRFGLGFGGAGRCFLCYERAREGRERQGNGGEYRKSYHGFASSVAYVIDAPQSLTVVPMSIDTWNRENMSITGGKFVPGPQPRHSGARPRHGEEIHYR